MCYLWPNTDFEQSKSKIKCPTFRNYLFRQLPPIEIFDYYPIDIPKYSKCSVSYPKNSRYCYTPALDPPLWLDCNSIHSNRIEFKRDTVEKLTIHSSPNSGFPLYDFNGDFYLKFFVLECYGTTKFKIFIFVFSFLEDSLDNFPFISTITFSILCGQKSEIHVFTTLQRSYFKDQKASISCFQTEIDMINELIQVVKIEDPDVLVGFEIDNKSWGYIAQRFDFLSKPLNLHFQSEISRYLNKSKHFMNVDPWIGRASSHFQVQGRISLNLWRIYRDEIAIRTYSLSDICKYYFQENVPSIPTQSLISLMQSDFPAFIKYALSILNHTCNLTIKTPFLVKSIEFSRLFGIDLFSTLTRGSQYRVESILITAAHSEDYLLLTPTESDVRSMRAAQGLPLTMEPESNYYRDPVLVLDFQSLYPSMIIAHNFCYSTVIGTVSNNSVVSCGAAPRLTPQMYSWHSFSEISNYDTYKAPGDIVFVRKEQKNGLLPRLLYEILSTRVAIKKAMKTCDSVSFFGV